MKTISDVTLSYLVGKLVGRINGSEQRMQSNTSDLNQALKAHLEDRNNPHGVQFSQLTGKALLEAVYPVGAIYLSTRLESPASLFGGSWARIQDRFLLAAGSTYTAGSVGGAAEQALTEAQLPEHSHVFHIGPIGGPKGDPYDKTRTGLNFDCQEQYDLGFMDTSIVGSTGKGERFSTMPPYQAVYAWQRTA